MPIVSGRLKPGEILHGEIETGGRLRVSRAAYREALRIRVGEGLLKALPKIGTHVMPQAHVTRTPRAGRWRIASTLALRDSTQALSRRDKAGCSLRGLAVRLFVRR